jgi:hypothetical protein
MDEIKLTRTLLDQGFDHDAFGDCTVAVNSSGYGVERTPSRRNQTWQSRIGIDV